MISKGFMVFMKEAPKHQKAWAEMVSKLNEESVLDEKTLHLCYLAILACTGLHSGIPFHTVLCKQSGASREEVKSCILLGLPVVGNKLIAALPIALEAYDNDDAL